MKLRIASLDDVKALARLYRTVQAIHAEAFPKLFRGDAPPEKIESGFREMISDSNAFWLIAEDSRPLGYLYATFREREETWWCQANRICYINHVSVEHKHRRSGVGRALCDQLFKEAALRGYERVELDVWSFNTEAKKAFQSLGFRVFNERMVYEPGAKEQN